MVSVEEALKLIEENLDRLPAIEVAVDDFEGAILAEDVHSPINMPPFNQSAMDGYALNYSEDVSSYEVIGEVAAGSAELFELKTGQAVRIFTGAAVPASANTVVKQEIVIREGNSISMEEPISMGQNIRPKGEQIQSGELALPTDSELNPAAVGFLTGLGIDRLKVFRRPKISVIATGDELVKPGTDLQHGQIYESNSFMLTAVLSNYKYTDYKVERVEDDYELTKTAIEGAFANSDVIILSGGISVGDHDYVGKVLNDLEVQRLFYKVNQKPGKPVFFGKKDKKLIFALPGNPAAAMTSFYTYILPALNYISGKKFEGLRPSVARITSDFESPSGRALFLKASVTGDEVAILDGQSSAMLRSFSYANALVYVPSTTNHISKGDNVQVMMIYKVHY